MTARVAPHQGDKIPFLSLPAEFATPRPASRLVPLTIVYRREKPGGFPRSRPDMIQFGFSAPGTTEISSPLAPKSSRTRSTGPWPAKEVAEGSDMIERLFALAAANKPLPGLRMAVVQPRQPPSTIETRENANAGKGTPRFEPTPAAAPLAVTQAAPPPPDINAIAEKVLQTLQRRERIERERRGII